MRLPSLASALILVVGSALAQMPQQPSMVPPPGDPPSRVARLNFMDGNVSFQPANVDAWTAANLNYPLTSGDHIYSDVGSHAEMHIGPNALRLGSQSNFGFLNLDDRTVQVRFTEGAVEVRLRRLDDDEIYEIDTPQGAISLLRTGDYRVDTDPSRNATMVTVQAGEAEVTAGGNSFAVHPRQTAFFAEGAAPDIRGSNPPDGFDSFTLQRNRDEDYIPPPVHVPPTMVGYQDLDRNGVWRDEPGYGWVWIPRVRAGWAPYHEGHWAWVAPWGWTWIDDSPWGFAPFHYGRWVRLGYGWAWMPGAVVARPVYAPALVAFVGGPGLGIAWFPLGPREPFYPSYRVSNVYVQQVNITHVTNVAVTNVNMANVRYMNQQVPGAITAVPQSTFVGARSVAAESRPVNSEQLAQARVMSGAQVAPQRESMLGSSGVSAAVPHPSAAIMARPVVSRTAPPSAAPSNRPAGSFMTAPAPVNRMDSRPPGAAAPAAVAAPVSRQAEAQRPGVESRPAADNRPAPAAENNKARAAADKKNKKDKKAEKKQP